MPDLIHFGGGLSVLLLLSLSVLRRKKLRRMPPWSYCSCGVKLNEMRAERKEVRGPELRSGWVPGGGRAVGAVDGELGFYDRLGWVNVVVEERGRGGMLVGFGMGRYR
jgi:hypothetical protein